MSDFGFWELALILFVALLVVGPDRLPALAATLGRWVGRARNIAAQFKADFMSETHADDLKSIMGKTRDAFDSAQHSIGEAGAEVNRALRNTDPLVQSIEDQIESGRFTGDTDGGTDTIGDTADSTASGTAPAAQHAGAAQAAHTDNTTDDTTPTAADTTATTAGADHKRTADTIGNTATAAAHTDNTTDDTTPAATGHKRTAGNTTNATPDNPAAAEHNPPAPQHETDARRQDPPVRRD